MLLTIKQHYADIRLPTWQPGTSSTAIAGLSIVLDLLVSYSVYFSGLPVVTAHNSGFAAALCLILLFRLSGIDPGTQAVAGHNVFHKTLSAISYFIVQSAIRAGCIASLSMFSVSETWAIGAGIAVATLISNYSSGLLLMRNNSGSKWLMTGIILAVCAFTLRLVFLGGMEVIPQEAYYWNYAQHLSPGYLDHPPLVAATIWLGEALFGHGYFGTRIGPFIYGIVFLFFFYRYARLQVDKNSAVFASALALILPYFFLGTGFLATPDASLAVAWVMALYFFYRALVNDESQAWYGVGLAMGIGMLSKYTIVLLAPAALLFLVFDSQSRKSLLRKEPYLSVLIALLVFSPVIYWNAVNDWASFAFQGGGRFDEAPAVYLDMMLTNIMAIVTPLPLLALPYLFMTTVKRRNEKLESPFTPRIRFFIASFLLLPMAIFAWNALENEPRYNWTGPLWITLLPLLAWLIVHAQQLRWKPVAIILERVSLPFSIFLICIFATLLQFFSIGLPGIKYPGGTARLLGWTSVAENMHVIEQQLQLTERQPGEEQRIVFLGRDKYFITSKLSYHGTPAFLGMDKTLEVTGNHLLADNSLMFAFWNPVEDFSGATVIMLARAKDDLTDEKLNPYFDQLSSTIEPFPVYKDNFNLPQQTIREYYYRIGYGYKPPKP